MSFFTLFSCYSHDLFSVFKFFVLASVCFLCSLSAGGSPARFLIIDDGWQDTFNEILRESEPVIDGAQ